MGVEVVEVIRDPLGTPAAHPVRRTLSYPADVKVVAMAALRIVQGGEAAFGRHYIDSNSCIWSGAANVPMLD
jgi:hypothetical protein